SRNILSSPSRKASSINHLAPGRQNLARSVSVQTRQSSGPNGPSINSQSALFDPNSPHSSSVSRLYAPCVEIDVCNILRYSLSPASVNLPSIASFTWMSCSNENTVQDSPGSEQNCDAYFARTKLLAPAPHSMMTLGRSSHIFFHNNSIVLASKAHTPKVSFHNN